MINLGTPYWKLTKPELIKLPKNRNHIVTGLEDVRNPECTRCRLHLTTTNVCVMGRGNELNPLIMMIGEAPGKGEELTGQPFMGKSGQKILQPTIDEFGLTPFTYITNICKCRPQKHGKDRKPLPDEMETCSTLYLRQEIYLLDPLILVLMGKTAFEVFKTDETAFFKHKLHLVTLLGKTRAIIATWHPAYCLRAGTNITNEFKGALKLVQKVLQRNELI